jgi:Mrp family chromosome partitioning ATPase
VSLAPQQVPALLDQLSRDFPDPIDARLWLAGRYRPTPTIVEAARHLYAHHDVSEIIRTEADATNLTNTAKRLESLISLARTSGEKVICFVTGVPGAGKTLVGLNLATAGEVLELL